MVYCNKCGCKNPDGSAFCSGCGATLTVQDPKPPDINQATGQSKPASSKNDGNEKKILSIVAVFIVIAAALVVMFTFDFGGDDDGNYDPVSGTWNYTAVPVVNNDETEFWNATMTITVDDNVMTRYNQNVVKTLREDMSQNEIDFVFNQIEAGGVGPGPTSLPGVVPPYRSEPQIIQDSYAYLENYIDRNHISYVTNGVTTVSVYQFDSQDGNRTFWVGSDGVIYHVFDESGEVPLNYYLNGWENSRS